MTPGYAKPRSELPWLPYRTSDKVFVINSHNFAPAINLKSNLVWWWDLSAADATITDQHSGLSLSQIGTTTTDATGGPDGGPCISFGDAAGKYRNASVAKTVSYDDGFTCNIWVRSTGSSSSGNLCFNHRDLSVGSGLYWQILARRVTTDDGVAFDAANTSRSAQASQAALNTWQMLTLRDTGGETELYRNAELVATSSTSLGARRTAAMGLAIGGAAWNDLLAAAVTHRGQLAMAGTWSEPLTAEQIAELYNAGSGLRYADL
jgi:hypothetical protein